MYIFCLCVCVCTHVHMCRCGDQRKVSGVLFFFSLFLWIRDMLDWALFFFVFCFIFFIIFICAHVLQCACESQRTTLEVSSLLHLALSTFTHWATLPVWVSWRPWALSFSCLSYPSTEVTGAYSHTQLLWGLHDYTASNVTHKERGCHSTLSPYWSGTHCVSQAYIELGASLNSNRF